jgi:hypothetical protein
MLILRTGDARAGVLVARGAVRDDDIALVNCLECVSCARVFFLFLLLLLLLFFIHVYLFLGAALGKISEYAASRTHCGARRGQCLTMSGA